MNLPAQYGVSDMERMARAFATSKLFGVQTPEQALALCLIAQAEGRHPASAANDYHIVNNRPTKKAEAMLRDFLASGGKVEWHALDDAQADATFSHPQGGTVRITWDHERRKAAGINTPMWTKYPRQMLRSRCVSEGVRTVNPAATSGMYEPSEQEDIAPPVQLRDVTPEKTPAEALPAPAGRRGAPQRALAAQREENGHSDDPDDQPPVWDEPSDKLRAYLAEVEGDEARAAINVAMTQAWWKPMKAANPGLASTLREMAQARIEGRSIETEAA